MAYFNTCFDCGSNLDPGEKCDCKILRKQKEELWSKRMKASPKTGQISFRWDGKEEEREKKATY